MMKTKCIIAISVLLHTFTTFSQELKVKDLKVHPITSDHRTGYHISFLINDASLTDSVMFSLGTGKDVRDLVTNTYSIKCQPGTCMIQAK